MPKLVTDFVKFTFLSVVYMCCAVLYITRCSLTAVDIIVLVLTWVKSFKQFKDMRRLGLKFSISAVLLRDGTLYFIVLLAFNIWDILTYSNSNFAEGNYAINFTGYLPPLLVQRFILNLRQLDYAANESSSDAQHSSHFSVRFGVPSDFLGNIGEPLDHGQSERVEGDDNDESCAVEESRNGPEVVFALHQSGLRHDPIEPDTAQVLRSAERASEEDTIESSAHPRVMVAGPGSSTSAY
ncbi:uncharacterized protein PHACADRAFT_207607 [Phanerochaete carnosa HHB-10118-sp]|uniref:Uncharacterized protein n=1 Tax=Phanerochaete carnosa (strain HHB-10118-sp) TaxID=650164 RepID=K5V1I8_PHACS|nr:uncharacterized protein PHACADRAFT_207607 [Phanerochaete carnosa HHB-10118-sp]EKM56346.1 hypothetical protein PHACADRAFT_207607 [Phanerochaete carnosa HHB-10118-sp]